jgi:CAAX prenyl protease-like protein
MTLTFLQPTLGHREIFNHGMKFVLAVGIITVTSFAQAHLRNFLAKNQDKILISTGLPYYRVAEIRRTARYIISILVTTIFFKDAKTSFPKFLKNHIFLLVLECADLLKTIEPFQSYIEKKSKNLPIPIFLAKLSEKIVTLAKPLITVRLKNPWLETFGSATLEEFVFRGILQEGILRQLPKLTLKITGIAPPESVDSSIFTVMRIGISALVFGVAHLHNKDLYSVIDNTLRGITHGYIHEKISFLGAIVHHFDVNFYVNIGRFLGPGQKHSFLDIILGLR